MKLLRFADLEERGIATSRAQLKNLIEKCEFPAGFMLAPNSRAWFEDEIASWLDTRPIAGPPPRGAAKAGKGRPRKAASEAVAS